MAYTDDIGGTNPATGSAAIFRLKTALKTAGWTVTKSSDGTTYNATGDQITLATSGAGGMANNSAWFIVSSPSVTYPRQIAIQRGTTNLDWKVKYSANSGFGTGTSTQMPAAADEVILFGGGTNASPTFAQLLGTDNTYRINIRAGGLAENYGFIFITNISGSAVINTNFILDPMLPGTFAAADIDPCCINIEYNSIAALNTNLVLSTASPQGWLKKGLAGAGFVRIQYCYIYANTTTVYPGGAGQNPFTTFDETVPILCARQSALAAPFGFKGVSSTLSYNGVFRASGDTLNVSTSKDRLIISGNATSTLVYVSIPWNGTDMVI